MKLIIALTLFASFSAFAGVELYKKEMNNTCVISKNKVVKTVVVNYGKTGVTTTTAIDTFGIEELAKTAHGLSTGRTIMEGYEMKVIVDGDEATLSIKDSKEAGSIIALLTKICN